MECLFCCKEKDKKRVYILEKVLEAKSQGFFQRVRGGGGWKQIDECARTVTRYGKETRKVPGGLTGLRAATVCHTFSSVDVATEACCFKSPRGFAVSDEFGDSKLIEGVSDWFIGVGAFCGLVPFPLGLMCISGLCQIFGPWMFRK